MCVSFLSKHLHLVAACVFACLLAQVPIGLEDKLSGIVDLVTGKQHAFFAAGASH